MLDHPSRTLRLVTGLMVLSGFLGLAAVRGYTPLLVLLPIAGLALQQRTEKLQREWPRFQTISLAVTIAFVCFSIPMFVILGPISGLVGFIIFIQLHLLLHRKAERHYYYMYLMTFFLMLAAAVQSPAPVIAFALLLFVVSGAWGLSAIRLDIDPLRVRAHPQPEVAAIKPKPTAVTEESAVRHLPINLTVAGSTTCVLVLTGIFFVVTPRIEAGFLGRDSRITITGLSQSVNLSGGAFVQEDPTPVMHAAFPEEPRGQFPPDEMYWRVGTFPSYLNSSWRPKGLSNDYMEGVGNMFAVHENVFQRESGPGPDLQRDEIPTAQKTVIQRIFTDSLRSESVPCLDLPVRVELQGSSRSKQIDWEGRQDVTVKLLRSNDNQLDYNVWSEILRPEPEVLRASPATYESLTRDDLNLLTEQDLLPETIALAESIVQPHNNNYDKVLAIESYLSTEGYFYTLNLPPVPETNAIDSFILETKQGHCEFFSSAMALMLRSVGIPTRVVNGYRGGEWQPGTQTYLVRNSMAHLWVEVYFEGFGWVRFDPSPPSLLNEPPTGVRGVIQRITDFQLRAQLFWYRNIISFDRGLQIERLRSFTVGLFRSFGFGDAFDEATQEHGTGGPGQAAWAVALLLMLGCTGLLGFWWFKRDRSINTLTPDQRRAVAMYTELRGRLTKGGVNVAGLSAEEIELRVALEGWTEFGDIQEILRLYNEVRFGQRPMEQNRLDDFVKRLRAFRFAAPQKSN